MTPISTYRALEILRRMKRPRGRELIGQVIPANGINVEAVITEEMIVQAWDKMLRILEQRHRLFLRRVSSRENGEPEYVDLFTAEKLLEVNGMLAAEQTLSTMPPADIDVLWEYARRERARRRKEAAV